MDRSAKTLNLLAVAHTYQQQGKRVLLLKPELDTRFGTDTIQSKAGIQQRADVIIKNNTNLLTDISIKQRTVDCMLVDEVICQSFLCLSMTLAAYKLASWSSQNHEFSSETSGNSL
jgi:thymidine kinase